jgi:hypothetical protein
MHFFLSVLHGQMGISWSTVMIVNDIPCGGKVQARSCLVKDKSAPVAIGQVAHSFVTGQLARLIQSTI